MNKKERIFVYKIYFPEPNKCYIGQTNDFKRRMVEHIRKDNGSLVHSALLKYDDWDLLVLHTCQSRDEANRVEIEEIRNFNCVSPRGYNLTHGGDAESPSDETRQKMSDAHKGKNNSMYGKHHTDEARKKISESTKGEKNPMYGKRHPDEMREKMTGKNNPMYGKRASDETRAKLRAARIGKQPMLGKRHTDETRQKMSESHKGKTPTDETKNKRIATRKKNAHIKRIKQFAELKEQARELGVDIDSIQEEQDSQQQAACQLTTE